MLSTEKGQFQKKKKRKPENYLILADAAQLVEVSYTRDEQCHHLGWANPQDIIWWAKFQHIIWLDRGMRANTSLMPSSIPCEHKNGSLFYSSWVQVLALKIVSDKKSMKVQVQFSLILLLVKFLHSTFSIKKRVFFLCVCVSMGGIQFSDPYNPCKRPGITITLWYSPGLLRKKGFTSFFIIITNLYS